MTKPLFDHSFVYPDDDIGAYIEFSGKVLKVGKKLLSNSHSVKVDTEHGIFHGFATYPPQVGYYAIIRIYSNGGGFYTDNKIISWSSNIITLINR